MSLVISPEINSLLESILLELSSDQEIYLVGGAVRDIILGSELHDLDFVLPNNPTALVKRIAKRMKCGYFMLDDERHTARIVYYAKAGDFFPLDFVTFTGNNLQEDLRNRDFTINAMAISIHDLSNVIDPLNGRKDLEDGQIRPCSPNALMDDPVRVLRAIRLAMQFNFNYVPGLHQLLQEAAPYLPTKSYERQRDEFFRILEGPQPARGMADCRDFGIFDTLIPDLVEQEHIPASLPHVLPLFEHTLSTMHHFSLLLEYLQKEAVDIDLDPWWAAAYMSELKPFAEGVLEYFNEDITPGRSKKGITLFGCLLHDVGKPVTMKLDEDDRLHFFGHAQVGADLAWQASKRLQLSNAECEWVKTLVLYHMHLLPFINTDTQLTRRAIYRFYNKVGEVGIAIALLSLGDTLATYGDTLPQTKWRQSLTVAKSILSAWLIEKDQLITPTLLLNGHDLQTVFGLKPGKSFGQLLAALEEAQASGEIQTRDEAKIFIHKRIDERKGEIESENKFK